MVCDRDRARAQALVSKLQAAFGAQRAADVEDPLLVVDRADGIVNATPMGMAENPRPPLDTSRLTPRHWVADIVYFPLETELLRAARPAVAEHSTAAGWRFTKPPRRSKFSRGEKRIGRACCAASSSTDAPSGE